MSTKLDHIKLGHCPLSDQIVLYRHGKNPNVALEKRHAEADVMSVVVSHMMHNSPNGSIKTFFLNGVEYELTVKPIHNEDQ